MTILTDLTIVDAIAGLTKKDFTAVELTQAHVDAMAEKKKLNVYITETPDLALAQAKASDEKYASGKAGKLEGIPLAIKDLFCTEGIRTTAASKMLENFVPAYESTVTAKLKDAGTVMLGKTNLDEFAMGSSNTTSAYGTVENPWRRKGDDRALVPGGSSGGSAAAVAARIALGATGTDTGGSIRQPAALCGIVGIKPTYGRCSRWGTVAFASSLDQAGVFARTVKDTALLLGAIAGYDGRDMTSVDVAVPDYAASLGQGVKGKRVGIPREYRIDGIPAETEANWQKGIDWLKDAGAEPVEVSLPHTKYAMAAYYIIAPAECSSNLARYDGIRYGLRVPGKDLTELYENTRAGFGAEVRRRIMIGTYVLSAGYFDAYYVRAQKVRTLIAQDFKAAFETCDFMLTPPAPSTAFAIGEKTDDPITMYLEDAFTIPASLAGLPGISVPSGLSSDGLPLGLQIIGKPFDEIGVFNAAEAIEKAAGFTARP
jgi:aspartyl-tRNA(Asn)/glutamyl-tRNA(Gln) amidotransferase subunit A